MRVLITAAAFCAVASSAFAAPSQLRLSVVGDPTNTLGVAWTTPQTTQSIVEYRPAGSSQAPQQTTGSAPQDVTGIGFVHTVSLAGLTPDTQYEYRVGDGAEWSDWHPFKTGAGACEPWSFIAVGDDRADPIINSGRGVSPKWGPIAEEAASGTPAPDLFINSGDLVYDGSETGQWVDWLDSSETVTSIIPHMPVLGNHDAKGPENEHVYNDVFFLPRNDEEQSESYYSFRYGNALFIAFTTSSNDDGLADDPRPFARQAAWMRRVLEQNTDAVWRFVFLHHPAFTSGGDTVLGFELGHPPDEHGQNAVILPLLDEFHVDFVIAGHNHWYERYEALRQAANTTTEGEPAAGPDQGTQHIITGGAGAVTLDIDVIIFNPLDRICENTQPGQVHCSGEHHFVRFDIRGHQVDVKTVATACQNVGCDHESVVIDTFSYTKGGVDACTTTSSSSSSGGAASSSSSAPATSAPPPVSSSSAAPPSSGGPTSSSASSGGGSSAGNSGANQGSSGSANPASGTGSSSGGAPAQGGCTCGSSALGGAAWAVLALAAIRARRRR